MTPEELATDLSLRTYVTEDARRVHEDFVEDFRQDLLYMDPARLRSYDDGHYMVELQRCVMSAHADSDES